MRDDDRQQSPIDRAPVADPLADLPETARELLFAAQRIIASEGLSRLTLARLSEYSGQNSALVSYYFGNKTGLLENVVASIIHDECLQTANRVRGLDRKPRLQTMMSEIGRWSDARQAYLVFFELLVHSFRHDSVRLRMVEMYRWYLGINSEMLEIDQVADENKRRLLRGIAQLLSAISDGMAVQALIGDPDVLPLAEPFEALEYLLGLALPELQGGGRTSE